MRGYLVGVVAVAVLVRLLVGGALLQRGGPEYVLASDDGDAYDAAARLAAFDTPIVMTERLASKWPATVRVDGRQVDGGDPATRWPEGYWLFLAAQYRVLGQAYASTIVLQAVAGGLGVWAGFALASEVLSRRAALLAGLAMALSSTGMYLSAALYAESLYIPLLLVALALVVRAVNRRALAPALLAGVALGLAEAMRPLALPVAAAVVGWTLWRVGRGCLRLPVAIVVGFGLAMLPLVVRELLVVGHVTAFTAGGAEAVRDQANASFGPLARLQTMFFSGGWAPLGEPWIASLDAAAVWLRGVEWLCAALGVVWLARRHNPSSVLLGLAVVVMLVPPLIGGLPLVRYRAPADPLLILAMAAAVAAIAARLRPSVLLRTPTASAACVLVGALTLVIAVDDLRVIGSVTLNQLSGPAAGTDFLNLYAGAWLWLHNPGAIYDLDAQLDLQQALTARASLLVPFFLPPSVALAVAWLALFPYGVAYAVWQCLGIVSLALSARWLGPRVAGRWSWVVWTALALLFLPVLDALHLGQTSAPMLLGISWFARSMIGGRAGSRWSVLGVLGWTLKPQLALAVVVAAAIARRWRTLIGVGGVVLAMSVAGGARIGLDGLGAYAQLSHAKLDEALWADPAALPGPTLLHASHWLFGVSGWSSAVGLSLSLAVVAGVAWMWRKGAASDESMLVQLAALPLAAVVAAPYALVHELMLWLASFWLLWRFTKDRPVERAVLLWLAAGIWAAANLGVAIPELGGTDVAGLFGVLLLVFCGGLLARRAHA